MGKFCFFKNLMVAHRVRVHGKRLIDSRQLKPKSAFHNRFKVTGKIYFLPQK